jgi:hypothetical protein
VRFRDNNKIYHLIDFEAPKNKDYIILESLNQVKEGVNYKSVHIITLEVNKSIIIGRTFDLDVTIKDISVSRIHGTINYSENKKVTIRDLGSKFGTLILLQNEFVMTTNQVSLQIGRSYLDIKCLPLYEYIEIESKRRKMVEDNKNTM